jgi:hypothetical protein
MIHIITFDHNNRHRRWRVVEVPVAAPPWMPEDKLTAAKVAILRVAVERRTDPPPSRLLPAVVTCAGSMWEEGGAESADAPPATAPDMRRRSRIRAHGAQSGGQIRRRLASRPQSPINATHATTVPVHATQRHRIRRFSSSSPHLIPEPPPPLLLVAKPSREPPCRHSSSPNHRRRSSSLHEEPQVVADL